MMNVSAYPYPPGDITTRQAVELIAVVVYPNSHETEARKRVRERIRYARKHGRIPLSDSLSAPDFFRWALGENADWAALANVEGLPRSATVVYAQAVCIATASCKASAMVIPGDPAKLREEFIRAETERQKLVEEAATDKKRIVELETEVAEWRERDRQMRAMRSASGKRRGRGNTF